MNTTLLNGDCFELLKTIPENSVDSVVTDPPYELGFMGKSWDSTGIANNVEMWKECLRVLKPGGHLLAFSGTRTYHRMASAIEDAGFEVRDMIEWVYGSGFPKSLNIAKMIDKRSGKSVSWFGKWLKEWRGKENIPQKEISKLFPSRTGGLTGCVANWELGLNMPTNEQFNLICKTFNLPFESLEEAEREVIGKGEAGFLEKNNVFEIDNQGYGKFNITKGTSEWEGWGTALKPSHESIMVAQKPFDSSSDIDYTVSICQTLFAQIVKKSSELNLNEKIQQSIAQWIAEKNINTLEDLSEVMDMLLSESEKSLSLNIVLSWLNILGEIWGAMSMFTTETKGSLIIELKILKSLEWENIFQNITQVKDNKTDGLSVSVLNVENLLNAVKLKLSYILTHSAQDNAILQEKKINFAPNHEPICMARKPLSEKTVAENCLKWGTGGINIDESRVGTEKIVINGGGGGEGTGWGKKEEINEERIGRFPANLIHDNSEEVRECFPNESERFFKSIIYQAKASKSERGKDNRHPTVKPIALMEYLINMVTPKDGIVLDPFMGSGSTGVAAKQNSYSFIGIEKELDYMQIAKARIESVTPNLFNAA